MGITFTLADLFLQRRYLKIIRSENWPKFRTAALMLWPRELGVTIPFIETSSPCENKCIESFSGNVKDELFNGEIFDALYEAPITT